MKRCILLLLLLPRLCTAQDSLVQTKVRAAYDLVQKYITEDASVKKPFAQYVRALPPPVFGTLTKMSDTSYVFECKCLPGPTVMLTLSKESGYIPEHIFEPGEDGMIFDQLFVRSNTPEIVASELVAALVRKYILRDTTQDTELKTIELAANAWKRKFLDYYQNNYVNPLLSKKS